MIKQALIVNLKANMPQGRLAAQICHASEMAFRDPRVGDLRAHEPEHFTPCVTKVVLKGWGDEHLKNLHLEAKALGIVTEIMEEDGFCTALAIGPGNKNAIDKITHGLVLW